MIQRRDILAMGGVALAGGMAMPPGVARGVAGAGAGLPVPPGGKLAFAVLRKGEVLGHHTLSFERMGEGLTVRIAVDLAVKFGPITLYRYHHQGSELWQGGTIMAIASATNDDGKHYEVSGKRGPEGFVVEGSKANRYVAPPDALPANHWNRAMLGGPLINTQDGRLMRPHIAALGPDTIPTASGTVLRASHYRMSGDVRLDTWYDASPNWAGLSFTATDGSTVRYARQV